MGSLYDASVAWNPQSRDKRDHRNCLITHNHAWPARVKINPRSRVADAGAVFTKPI